MHNIQSSTKEVEYMTRNEAADYLRVSVITLDRLINRKDFHGKVNTGSRVLVIKKELDKYLRAIGKKNIFNFLSDEGLLPNYAFPEAGIHTSGGRLS